MIRVGRTERLAEGAVRSAASRRRGWDGVPGGMGNLEQKSDPPRHSSSSSVGCQNLRDTPMTTPRRRYSCTGMLDRLRSMESPVKCAGIRTRVPQRAVQHPDAETHVAVDASPREERIRRGMPSHVGVGAERHRQPASERPRHRQPEPGQGRFAWNSRCADTASRVGCASDRGPAVERVPNPRGQGNAPTVPLVPRIVIAPIRIQVHVEEGRAGEATARPHHPWARAAV